MLATSRSAALTRRRASPRGGPSRSVRRLTPNDARRTEKWEQKDREDQKGGDRPFPIFPTFLFNPLYGVVVAVGVGVGVAVGAAVVLAVGAVGAAVVVGIAVVAVVTVVTDAAVVDGACTSEQQRKPVE